MSDVNEMGGRSGTEAALTSVQSSEASATHTKKKLLEEYQDHVGGGGFHAWASWAYSF